MNAFEQRKQNDLAGLHWVHRFGWIRTTELGPLLWPGNASARHQADRLARDWLKRGLVLARPLPEGAGRALVLATAGVRLLAENNVKATLGKDIGKLVEDPDWRPPLALDSLLKWLPPKTWRHDLLAAGVLVDLHCKGWTIYPEREIRQRSGWLAKLPDGLAVRDAAVVWLEVERASKTGPQGRDLTEALCAVGANEAGALVLGHRPTIAMVAYDPTARDARGCKLDHRARIKAAVAAATKKPVSLIWAACTLRGTAGLDSVTYEGETIQSDRAAAVRKVGSSQNSEKIVR